VSGDAQESAQVPPKQACPEEQTFPQVPQLAASVRISAQEASAPMPQETSGDAQESAQFPPEQACPEGHAFPQAPQLAASVRVSAQ
jgi:hypothetical protein